MLVKVENTVLQNIQEKIRKGKKRVQPFWNLGCIVISNITDEIGKSPQRN